MRNKNIETANNAMLIFENKIFSIFLKSNERMTSIPTWTKN